MIIIGPKPQYDAVCGWMHEALILLRGLVDEALCAPGGDAGQDPAPGHLDGFGM